MKGMTEEAKDTYKRIKQIENKEKQKPKDYNRREKMKIRQKTLNLN